MAHEISTVSGEAEVFTAHQRPWHGLGVTVPDSVKSSEAIKLARLDWLVEQAPVYIKDRSGNVIELKNDVANVRYTPEGQPVHLGTVSKQYKPIQNIEAFDFFDSVVGDKLAIYETAGAIRDGKRVFITAKLPGDLVIQTPGGEDPVEKYLLFVNGHDGLFGCRMFFSPIRVVCSNTLRAALGGADQNEGIFIRHKGDVQAKVEEAVRILGIANKHYQDLGLLFNHFCKISFNEVAATEYFEKVFPVDEGTTDRKQRGVRTRQEACMNNFLHGRGSELSKNTLWGAYNAVTEFADHSRYDLRKARAEHSRFESVLFGDSHQIKGRALNLAVKISEADKLLATV